MPLIKICLWSILIKAVLTPPPPSPPPLGSARLTCWTITGFEIQTVMFYGWRCFTSHLHLSFPLRMEGDPTTSNRTDVEKLTLKMPFLTSLVKNYLVYMNPGPYNSWFVITLTSEDWWVYPSPTECTHVVWADILYGLQNLPDEWLLL